MTTNLADLPAFLYDIPIAALLKHLVVDCVHATFLKQFEVDGAVTAAMSGSEIPLVSTLCKRIESINHVSARTCNPLTLTMHKSIILHP